MMGPRTAANGCRHVSLMGPCANASAVSSERTRSMDFWELMGAESGALTMKVLS